MIISLKSLTRILKIYGKYVYYWSFQKNCGIIFITDNSIFIDSIISSIKTILQKNNLK